MRIRFIAAAVILLVAVPLFAQMRESIEVRVLELEATVLDRAGHPVEGLSREDFRVQVGKQEAPVTNFFAVRNGVVLAESNTTRVAKQQIAAETSIPTSLVIFVDELHLNPGSRRRAFEALKKYVSANVGSNTTAMIIRYYNHFDVRLRPTERPGPVIAELERLEKSPIADELDRERARMIGLIDGVLGRNFAEQVDINGDSPDTIFGRLVDYAERRVAEVDHTLAALEQAIELSSSFSGRRVLLYVSDGLPQTPALEVFLYWDRMQMHAVTQMHRNGTIRLDSSVEAMRFDRSSAFHRVAAAAQRANVAVYSFDSGSLRSNEIRAVESVPWSDRIDTVEMNTNLRQGLQYVAEETGGLYIANENNVDKVLARMSEQFSSYYSIGIQPRRGEIRISVRNRPELRVVAVKRTPPRSREERLEQSLRSRLYTRSAENPLAITAELGSPAKVNGQCTVPVVVRMSQPALPAELHAALTVPAYDMYLVMLNEENEETAVQRVSLPVEGQRFARTMMLRVRPERHVLSLAVSNPASDETSFLQREIDATACR
jgi:VWFA-related protein